MPNLDWSRLDDVLFVSLASDILRARGFADIRPLGQGPDGGLDILATELLPFALKGKTPFRWGVQCKFTKDPASANAVGESDVRDVEATLSDPRFGDPRPQGYALISNRKVTVTVSSRLRGIDERGAFRTATLSWPDLEAAVAADPQIVRKYFGPENEELTNLGPPAVVASIAEQRSPKIEVDVAFGSARERIAASIDTGSVKTFVPISLMRRLRATTTRGFVVTNLATGMPYTVNAFVVDLVVAGRTFAALETYAMNDAPYVVIGSDVLSSFVVVFDGPRGNLKLWPSPAS